MGAMEKKSESMIRHAFGVNVTQFEITSDLLRNLYKFDLTPVTKLVLLELTTHLNESRNGAVVFPSVGYIAEVLGIGLTACKKAINDLIKAGLIIKTKRNNVKGNYNKYLFTSKISGFKKEDVNILSRQDIKMRNSTSERSQNGFFKQSENDFFLHEQKKETKKEPTVKKNLQVDSNSIEIEEFKILKDYAQKNCTSTPERYLNWILKHNDVRQKILSDYRGKENAKKRALRAYEESQSLLKSFEDMKKNCVTAESCGYSLKDLRRKGIIK